jgi:hypothetical protein
MQTTDLWTLRLDWLVYTHADAKYWNWTDDLGRHAQEQCGDGRRNLFVAHACLRQ